MTHTCAAQGGCFEKRLETIFVGPNNEDYCGRHFVEAWAKWKRAEAERLGLAERVAAPHASPFTSARKTGVMIEYPGQKKPVRSIWTKTRCYPYPNWRHRLGLKGSYPTETVKVVDWGKSGAPVSK